MPLSIPLHVDTTTGHPVSENRYIRRDNGIPGSRYMDDEWSIGPDHDAYLNLSRNALSTDPRLRTRHSWNTMGLRTCSSEQRRSGLEKVVTECRCPHNHTLIKPQDNQYGCIDSFDRNMAFLAVVTWTMNGPSAQTMTPT